MDGSLPGRLAEKFAGALSRLMERFSAMDTAQLPLLRSIPVERRYPAVAITLLVALLLAIGSAIWHVRQVANQGSWVEIATRLQMLSQRYSKTAQQAVLGNKEAFKQLDESRKAFAEGLNTLIEGGEEAPASPAAIQPTLNVLKQRWEISRQNIKTLIAQQDKLVELAQSLNDINGRTAELLDLTQQVITLLPAGNPRLIALSYQQALWSQRMAKNANALIGSDLIDPENAYQLGQDVQSFRNVLDAMLKGNERMQLQAVNDPDTMDKLQELNEVFTAYEARVNAIHKSLPQLVEAKRAARAIFDEGEQLLNMTRQLTADYQGLRTGYTLFLTILFGLLVLALLVLPGILNVADARRRAEENMRENKRNQDAILRLLNEMGDLAEGDLTVQATVTEDITGAIADSVNYAIDELRMLVNNINRATAQVTEATDDAKRISDELLAAAERQSQQIARTGEAIDEMTRSILNVSQNAAESARVAEQSLATAKKGGDSVQKSIAGMNALRDQIQETAKRIKRLGESSQEIGEIVELIGDITEQTNVLALNAAIQAAAAGEAGRGFSVVAEEVQRLAERSANATRRIGAIVKAIQGDTQDAVNAMEVSTQGVVEGTVLSDAAGHALQEIESVSAKLARLIQDISAATQDQVRTAEGIAQNMQEILKVTRQTSDGARRSAQSMDQLTALAEELKVSASGFKL
ncbi:MAG: methyl-accepting chemotaxis protein [Thiobacillaceae bacterium]